MVIREGLGYINKDETPTSRETIFVKGKKETPSQVASPSTPKCTHYRKSGHTQKKCYTKLEGFESQMNQLMNYFNFLKNNILYIGKEEET